MAVRVRRVARPAVVAEVERQELGRAPVEPGRHRDQLGVDREVDDRPAAERDVRSGPGRAGTASSRARPSDCVSGFFNSAVATGMPLTNRQRSSVFVALLIRQLPDDGQPVRLVPLDELRRQPVGRLEDASRISTPWSLTPWRSTSTVPRSSSSFASRRRKFVSAAASPPWAGWRGSARRCPVSPGRTRAPRPDRGRVRRRTRAHRPSRTRRGRVAMLRSRPRTSTRRPHGRIVDAGRTSVKSVRRGS